MRHRILILTAVLVIVPVVTGGCAGTSLREDHFPDGSIRARYHVRENERGDEVSEGAFTEWHENGRVARRGRFAEGKRHGLQSSWYASGEKRSERRYDNGRLDGASRAFYERGGKKDECVYRQSRKHGAERRWYPNGELSWEAHYEEGVLKRFFQYDAAGKIIEQFDVDHGFGEAIR